MLKEIKELQEERKKIYHDFFNNKIPKRVPVNMYIPRHLMAEYSHLDMIDCQYDYTLVSETAKKLCRMIYSDKSPVYPASIMSRPPGFYQILGSQSFVMGNKGFVQHPEVIGMEAEEFKELIADPYAFLLEKVIPRQHKNLNPKNPIEMMITLQRGMKTLQETTKASLPLYQECMEEFGYYPGAPMGSTGFSEAPYDFLADQLRGFSEISKDIRRNRNLLKDASEAVLPLLFYWALPSNPNPEGSILTPLHMPTFMREKDFVEIWLPTYKTMLEMYAAKGVRVCAFCEGDWMRYLDIIESEFPAGTHLMFEYGEPKIIKEKLGKKFLIQGLYPISLIKTGTKQQCIDKAKELLDIMMPGGGYLFGFDKDPLVLGDVNLENLQAVAEFVRDYAIYPNAGETFGQSLNSEGFVFDEKKIPPIKSKYIFDFKDFKEKNPLVSDFSRSNFESYDKEILNFLMYLLV